MSMRTFSVIYTCTSKVIQKPHSKSNKTQIQNHIKAHIQNHIEAHIENHTIAHIRNHIKSQGQNHIKPIKIAHPNQDAAGFRDRGPHKMI